MDRLTDAELVGAARSGNMEAFGELVRRHQRAAVALAYSVLGDAVEAEDMAQEAFLRAMRNLDLLADPTKFAPWLRRLVFGTCVDWLRAFRPELYRTSGAPGAAERVPSAAASPLERLEQVELSQRVLAATERLPPRYRVPLSMYHLNGVSQRKVAAALGMEESSVRSLLTRARQRLAPLLESYAKEVFPMDRSLDEVLEEQTRPPRLLHVLNGDVTRRKLERSDVPGTFAVWADVLHEGPIPAEEAAPEEWREVRARYIEQVGYASYDEALQTSRRWDEALERYPEYEEVVIWCEHDLFDQLLLIRHLNWFGRRELGGTRLSLICIGSYPGVPDFKGLGQLSPDQLASLLETRQPVTRRQIELGRVAWRAFTSPDPTGIQRFVAGDTSAFPFLAPALRRHLEEFPSMRNGLSRTEEEILRLLTGGLHTLVDLFHAVHLPEDAFYIADASFWTVLQGLASGAAPAVELEFREKGHGFLPKGTARITESGRALLAGREDWVRLHGINRWLGGVHLKGDDAAWRWDVAEERLVSRSRSHS